MDQTEFDQSELNGPYWTEVDWIDQSVPKWTELDQTNWNGPNLIGWVELGSISSSTYLDSDQNWVWIKVIYSHTLCEIATS